MVSENIGTALYTAMWWGVSYEGCSANPVSGYTRQQLRLDTDYRYKMLPGFYLGATLNLNYTRALNMGAPEYLEGQKDSYYFTGLGLSLQYDTRDLIMNPSRGIYFMAREVIYPKVFSTHDRTVWGTTIIFDAFVPAWKGGVVAFDLYGQLNSRDTPWTLREEPGPFSLPLRSSTREGFSRTTGLVSASSSSTG